MIRLSVKVNRTGLCTEPHFTRNEIKYHQSQESGLFFLQMLLAVPFIRIGGKQKITVASFCDKKEIL